jgi:hypothetical protein
MKLLVSGNNMVICSNCFYVQHGRGFSCSIILRLYQAVQNALVFHSGGTSFISPDTCWAGINMSKQDFRLFFLYCVLST